MRGRASPVRLHSCPCCFSPLLRFMSAAPQTGGSQTLLVGGSRGRALVTFNAYVDLDPAILIPPVGERYAHDVRFRHTERFHVDAAVEKLDGGFAAALQELHVGALQARSNSKLDVVHRCAPAHAP